MKNAIRLSVLSVILIFGNAFCDRPLITLHIGADGQYPVNGFIPGNGVGGLGTVNIGGTYTGIAMTLSSGFIYHLKESDVSQFNEIPIMAGLKFNPALSPVYFCGELGDVIEQVQTSGAATGNSSAKNFGWDVGGGWEFGPFDLRMTYNEAQVNDSRDAMSVSLKILVTIWDNL